MSFTLELSPREDEQIRREAAIKGIAPDTLLREIIVRHQRRIPRWARLTQEEEAQISTLNAQLPPPYWRRFNDLQKRHTALSPNEQEEFVQLWEQAEVWNVRRLDLLEMIAQKRGKHYPQLMKVLRIKHHPSAERDATST